MTSLKDAAAAAFADEDSPGIRHAPVKSAIRALFATPMNFGQTSPAVDSGMPGAIIANFTETTTATAANPQIFGVQIGLFANHGSNSLAVDRGLYVRAENLSDFDLAEIIAGSGYAYVTGDGDVANVYGWTSQALINAGSPAIVGSGVGNLNAVRVETGATGKYTLGRGSINQAVNKRATGVGFDFAVGAYNVCENTSGGTITDATACECELLLSGSAGSMPTGRLISGVATLASGASAGTLVGLRTKLANGGTVTNWTHWLAQTLTGSAPGTGHYLFYSEDVNAAAYLEGQLEAKGKITTQTGFVMNSVRIRGFSGTIADDAATFFSITAGAWGGFRFYLNVNATAADGAWDAVGTYAIGPLAEKETLATIDWTTGALAGTTGTDNRVTVSINSANDRIYIENRSGGSIAYIVELLEKV